MKLMKAFPGGTLLVPMFVSALITTFVPNLFKIGGLTEAIFSGASMSFLLASAVFLSGTLLNLRVIGKVFRRYGILMATRLLVNTIFGILYVKFFGLEGIFGISSIAFIVTLTSMNPTIFLAIMNDYGDEVDKAAFGFLALCSIPVVPMFIYGLTSPTEINFMPLMSTLFPLLIGIIIGNLDKDLAKYLSSGMNYIIFFLGWTVGAGINLLDALKSGLPGILMALLYYLISFVPVFLVEKIILKREGIGAVGMSTIAGLSASIPLMMTTTNPELTPYSSGAAAIVSLCVIISAIVSPSLAKKLHKKNND